MSKKHTTKQEEAAIADATTAIRDIECSAHKLQDAIAQADGELKELANNTVKLHEFARHDNPFQIYQNDFLGMHQRRQVLRAFIDDMSPIIPEMLAAIAPYREQIVQIEAGAAQRINDIQMLEERMLIDGDLPAEQKRLLLSLKGQIA